MSSESERAARRKAILSGKLEQLGTSGRVYSFIHVTKNGSKEKLAVKKICISELNYSEKRYVFREMTTLASLCHENVIDYVDSWENDDYIYVVTEYCECGNIGTYTEGKRFSVDTYLHWLLDMCRSLEYLSEKGVIHRNIKPSSILVTRYKSGIRLKLGNFGIAKVLEPGKSITGTVLGTPSFISPEIAERQTYDGQTDVWSLGVCFQKIVRGHVSSTEKTQFRNLPQQVATVMGDEHGTEFSTVLTDVIKKMTLRDPKKRSKPDELITSLSKILETFSDSDSKSPEPHSKKIAIVKPVSVTDQYSKKRKVQLEQIRNDVFAKIRGNIAQPKEDKVIKRTIINVPREILYSEHLQMFDKQAKNKTAHNDAASASCSNNPEQSKSSDYVTLDGSNSSDHDDHDESHSFPVSHDLQRSLSVTINPGKRQNQNTDMVETMLNLQSKLAEILGPDIFEAAFKCLIQKNEQNIEQDLRNILGDKYKEYNSFFWRLRNLEKAEK